MCRLLLYQGRPIQLASLITDPKHSLINQSFNARERDEPLNGDGFGLAWFNHHVSKEPALFKSITPAWNNRNLQELSRVIESSCILAHVRAATQSLEVSETNCHPFKYQNFVFMHNGDVGGFRYFKRRIHTDLGDEAFNMIKGSTDSEHLFALIIDELLKIGSDDDHMVQAIQKTLQRVVAYSEKYGQGEKSYMNFVLSNGNTSVAVRFTTDNPDYADSLYMNSGRKYKCEDGVCYMVEPNEDDRAIIISSEPLSKDPGWVKIPVFKMIVVRTGEEHKEITVTI